MGIIGESGSGKSVFGEALFGLLPESAELRGKVRFDGKDVFALTQREKTSLWGSVWGLVPQLPHEALSPLRTIDGHLRDVRRGAGMKPLTQEKAAELLRSFELAEPERVLRSYPHELSGGTPIRTSSRAACCSASSAPWQRLAVPHGFWQMSRRRASMKTHARPLVEVSHVWRSGRAARFSSLRTILFWHTVYAIVSLSCTRGRSWNFLLLRRSLRRIIRIRRRCCGLCRKMALKLCRCRRKHRMMTAQVVDSLSAVRMQMLAVAESVHPFMRQVQGR